MIKLKYPQTVYNDVMQGANLQTTTRLALNEHHIYGSSRLGVKRVEDFLIQEVLDGDPVGYDVSNTSINTPEYIFTSQFDEGLVGHTHSGPEIPKFKINKTRGYKQYELTNHLGNVMVTLSDRKVGIPNTAQTHYTSYTADVYTAQEYFAFGSPIFERKFSGLNIEGYRYGFNGMEKDDEVKGIGNSLDFGARIYDSRLGRWLAVDPEFKKYTSLSPYVGIGNSPTLFIDVDGEDIIVYGINALTNERAAIFVVKSDLFHAEIETKMPAPSSDVIVMKPTAPTIIDIRPYGQKIAVTFEASASFDAVMVDIGGGFAFGGGFGGSFQIVSINKGKDKGIHLFASSEKNVGLDLGVGILIGPIDFNEKSSKTFSVEVFEGKSQGYSFGTGITTSQSVNSYENDKWNGPLSNGGGYVLKGMLVGIMPASDEIGWKYSFSESSHLGKLTDLTIPKPSTLNKVIYQPE